MEIRIPLCPFPTVYVLNLFIYYINENGLPILKIIFVDKVARELELLEMKED